MTCKPASAREAVQLQLVAHLCAHERSTWTAPYGVLPSIADLPAGGKVRTVTWGVARTLDATAFIWTPTRIHVQASGPLAHAIGGDYTTLDELLAALAKIEARSAGEKLPPGPDDVGAGRRHGERLERHESEAPRSLNGALEPHARSDVVLDGLDRHDGPVGVDLHGCASLVGHAISGQPPRDDDPDTRQTESARASATCTRTRTMTHALAQVCQFCSCPVDASKDKPGCHCVCHRFAPSRPDSEIQLIRAMPEGEQYRALLARARRRGRCPSGDHSARSCPTREECREARNVIENMILVDDREGAR